MRYGLLLLGLLLIEAGGCAAPGPLATGECDCQSGAQTGAVVVRWRVLDEHTGRLFSRGQCCCSQGDTPLPAAAARQCDHMGSDCPVSPAWLIRDVRLNIAPVSGARVCGQRCSAAPCYIRAECIDAELTTGFCLAEGSYDLQLSADVYYLGGDQAFSRQAQALYPPAVRRIVRAGEIVNLDALVLTVNGSMVVDLGGAAGDGGVDGGG